MKGKGQTMVPRKDPYPTIDATTGATKTAQSPEVIGHFLKALERPSKTLTAWELGFLASVGEQFDANGSLSEKQFARLEQIYVNKTD